MDFTEVVRRRRMVRNYTDEPVPRETVARIVGIARKVPSAGFAQGQRFVVVTEEERRRALARVASEERYTSKGFDPWLSSAPVHVVLCVDERAYRARYEAVDKRSSGGGPGDWDVPYQVVDGGAALMLLLLAAVDEGLAAGFFGAHRLPGLKEMLDIPDGVVPLGVVTIGHPAPDRRSGSVDAGRRAFDEIVHWEQWSEG